MDSSIQTCHGRWVLPSPQPHTHPDRDIFLSVQRRRPQRGFQAWFHLQDHSFFKPLNFYTLIIHEKTPCRGISVQFTNWTQSADPILNKNGLLRIRLLRPQLLGTRCRNRNTCYQNDHAPQRNQILLPNQGRFPSLSKRRLGSPADQERKGKKLCN